MATSTLDRAAILQAVHTWAPDEQRALAREILRHAGEMPAEEPLAPPDSAGLAGLLSTKQAPPTDEEAARWLDERRAERYG